MKSRQNVPAAELMAETINATKRRGALDPAAIKEQIDKYVLLTSTAPFH